VKLLTALRAEVAYGLRGRRFLPKGDKPVPIQPEQLLLAMAAAFAALLCSQPHPAAIHWPGAAVAAALDRTMVLLPCLELGTCDPGALE
jgi:hypothetical protein